mmetsp:Transcript_37438/g.60137  ORF Transcript_37438/g.60137 Transcript_37438/m.60137 type:complete len:347 (+) Transcript_37438:899-1939(+)
MLVLVSPRAASADDNGGATCITYSDRKVSGESFDTEVSANDWQRIDELASDAPFEVVAGATGRRRASPTDPDNSPSAFPVLIAATTTTAASAMCDSSVDCSGATGLGLHGHVSDVGNGPFDIRQFAALSPDSVQAANTSSSSICRGLEVRPGSSANISRVGSSDPSRGGVVYPVPAGSEGSGELLGVLCDVSSSPQPSAPPAGCVNRGWCLTSTGILLLDPPSNKELARRVSAAATAASATSHAARTEATVAVIDAASRASSSLSVSTSKAAACSSGSQCLAASVFALANSVLLNVMRAFSTEMLTSASDKGWSTSSCTSRGDTTEAISGVVGNSFCLSSIPVSLV